MGRSAGSCAIVSFRLGQSDGVSVVAAAWEQALQTLGWQTYRVAGAGPVDHTVAGLAIDAAQPPGRAEVEAALADADLVLVENLLSIPMNLPASRVVAAVLAGRPAILHHHDPPWQRSRFAHITELPPDDPCWTHVTINHLTAEQFASRGLRATTIYNGFQTSIEPGDRAATRRQLGLSDDQLLVAHPVRAIERKNVPAAVAMAEALGAVYWLPGAAEEGYGRQLDQILRRAKCPVLRRPLQAPTSAPSDGPALHRTVADLYAACDLVAFPSTWEGFGNPPVEAAIHGRPVAVGDYPVARELRAMGFAWYEPTDVDRIRAGLADPGAEGGGPAGSFSLDEALDANRRIVERELSIERMTESIADLVDQTAWSGSTARSDQSR